ncbi:MAG TPA: HD domain-containing protein [Hyphomicrobiales bacterium]|nr:HD domain-containing protein [Hyphomicrobiales bacterium]
MTDHSNDERPWPQQGYTRMIMPSPLAWIGTDTPDPEPSMLPRMNDTTVFMMGDNPALPRMPDKPTLIDFFKYRFNPIAVNHLLSSAKRALDEGRSDAVVMACLLHDFSNGCLIRPDHGYWSAQMIAPYVDEEVAWAVKYHQALRYFPDPKVGYAYPESYYRFFGRNYEMPEYLRRDGEYAMTHKWYMTARLVTMYDIYFFEDKASIEPEYFNEVIGRAFRQPAEGLGHDDSPVSHMWRTMIWPNNFL